MREGFIHVYTGNGKGKTTAALGLLVRACGARLRVYLAQFLKHGRYCEIRTLRERFPEVTLRQFGSGCFVRGRPTPRDVALARKGLKAVRAALAGGKYDVVIMDEANAAVAAGLFPVGELLALMDEKPSHVEMIITGRGAHKHVLARADLVTEMRDIKHYFRKGIKARRGIEW